jgi:hypothetical protein
MSWKTHSLQSTEHYLHIHNRAANGGNLFSSEEDFLLFLPLMADFLPRVEISLLAYTLLPTEFRFVVHQKKAYAISQYVQRICSKYARSTNRCRKRTGPLFEGRFKIEGIEDEPPCYSYPIPYTGAPELPASCNTPRIGDLAAYENMSQHRMADSSLMSPYNH